MGQFIYTAAFLGYWFFVRRVRAPWNITWVYLGAELFVCFWWLVTFALIAWEGTLLEDYEPYFNDLDRSVYPSEVDVQQALSKMCSPSRQL